MLHNLTNSYEILLHHKLQLMNIHQIFPEPVYESKLDRELTKNELSILDKFKLKNYFNENTCVGTLYINGHTLMDDCILEFNFGELDAGSIPDTSGNANYAIVIGDYGLKKASENLHLRRDTTIKIPKIGSTDKAL